MDILIVHIEAREAERQPAVEQRSLVADLVAVDLFGVEGEEIVDILIGPPGARIADRCRGARAARVEAAALEPLRIGGVDHVVVVRSDEHTSELQSLMRTSY